MTNTERLYVAIRDFMDNQRENRETYLRKKKELERFLGSKGYQAELDYAMKIRKDADEAARIKCRKIVEETIADMIKKNNARRLEAPTEEQIRFLTVAQMMEKPSKIALDNIAKCLGGNGLALAALSTIARNAWKDDPNILERYVPRYEEMATDNLSTDYVNNMIQYIQSSCVDIIQGSGENRIRVAVAKEHAKRFGGNVDLDDLPAEEQYQTERDFYERKMATNYSLFAKAVN